jgi:WD40-like Beta Propeller Repeat
MGKWRTRSTAPRLALAPEQCRPWSRARRSCVRAVAVLAALTIPPAAGSISAGTFVAPHRLTSVDGSARRELGAVQPPGTALPAGGAAIVFASDYAVNLGFADVFVIGVNGAGKRNLTNSPGVAESHVTPSPDGRFVAYVRDEREAGDSPTELWLMEAKGGGARRLGVTTPDARPVWSPTGRWLAFAEVRRTHARIGDGVPTPSKLSSI